MSNIHVAFLNWRGNILLNHSGFGVMIACFNLAKKKKQQQTKTKLKLCSSLLLITQNRSDNISESLWSANT